MLQCVSRKAKSYQPMSSREWNSSVRRGMALAMMVLSCGNPVGRGVMAEERGAVDDERREFSQV